MDRKEDSRLKILITNDDGIFAPGVEALADLLSHFGEVVLVCPDTEKSAYSHKITLRQPLKLKKLISYRTMLRHTRSMVPLLTV